MNLLHKVASFENLLLAYQSCRRGKKATLGDQKFFTNYPERLLELQDQLLNNTYRWGEYREFYVIDPKKRLIMAAPFKDRIIHHAIHRVISPMVENGLSDSVCACRLGMGNQYAVLELAKYLRDHQNRHAIKLDVKQYFPSIDHKILFEDLNKVLPDISLSKLLWTLIQSHPRYAKIGSGIPIGNLTSQLFANFYLVPVDKVVCDSLGIEYKDRAVETNASNAFYLRYMDDLLIISDEKNLACIASKNAVSKSLDRNLIIPIYKRMHLGNDPIPFLGYLVRNNQIAPLSRNIRKIKRRITRLEKTDQRDSYKAMVRSSYDNWASLKL